MDSVSLVIGIMIFIFLGSSFIYFIGLERAEKIKKALPPINKDF